MIRGEEGGATVTRAQGAAPAGGRNLRPSGVTVAVAVIGLVITAGVAWTAWTLNRHNEHRLLVVQTHQAAAVLGSTILSLGDPLATELSDRSGHRGLPRSSSSSWPPTSGPGRPSSRPLWRSAGTSVGTVAPWGHRRRRSPARPEALAIIWSPGPAPARPSW